MSKKIKFIDYPKEIDIKYYENLIDKILEISKSKKDIKSIYQIGSINNPGISDLDLVFIFENNKKCMWEPRKNLTTTEKYILVHNCFGASEFFFKEAQNYSFFSNYKLLLGKKYNIGNNLNLKNLELLKTQIALEYMLKMYITLTTQLFYGILKVRSLLLEIKAIKYDLEFLNIENHNINKIVNNLIEIRNNWFKRDINLSYFKDVIIEFYNELELVLTFCFKKNKFVLKNEKISLTKNIVIQKNDNFKFEVYSKFKSNIFYFLGKKYFNFLNKFNIFYFYVPFKNKENDFLQNYFFFIKSYKEYNKKFLKNFSPLVSSLN